MERGGFLTDADLDVLQDVYESATANVYHVDDATMHDIVSKLILHYQAGERDKDKLVRVVAAGLRRDVV
jgi:hypothetical protein